MADRDVNAAEVATLRSRLRQFSDAFNEARAAANWQRLKELDTQMQRMLRPLMAREDWRHALQTELTTLRAQHALALQTCREQLSQIEEKMQAFQREREGLTAYGQFSESAQ